jgi:DNA-directed RNA polymerase alpha subunit
MDNQNDFPRLAAPAQRALANAGIANLSQLARHSEAEVSKLHGMGPNALKRLKEAMVEKGLSFTKNEVIRNS